MSRPRALLATLLALASLCLAIGLLPVAPAHADADPASDVLLSQSAFYPYQPPAPPRLEAALNGLLSQASRAGMGLKVAIVGSREDLGAIPTFFGQPEKYAAFLDREISFNQPQPLLVVMPAGFGLAHAGPAAALSQVRIDGAGRTEGLIRTAVLAVVALARANGHPLPVPSLSAGRTGGGPPVLLLFGLPVLLLVLAGIPLLTRRRS